jgi:hypothetical protein
MAFLHRGGSTYEFRLQIRSDQITNATKLVPILLGEWGHGHPIHMADPSSMAAQAGLS